MVLEKVTDFLSGVSNQINITFKSIDDFIDTIVTFFVSMSYWTSLLFFFLLFFGIILVPLWLFKYADNIKNSYRSLMNKTISSMTKR